MVPSVLHGQGVSVMKLFDEKDLPTEIGNCYENDFVAIVRVPGGWVFIDKRTKSDTFVPIPGINIATKVKVKLVKELEDVND
jgi:hypothetical protein